MSASSRAIGSLPVERQGDIHAVMQPGAIMLIAKICRSPNLGPMRNNRGDGVFEIEPAMLCIGIIKTKTKIIAPKLLVSFFMILFFLLSLYRHESSAFVFVSII